MTKILFFAHKSGIVVVKSFVLYELSDLDAFLQNLFFWNLSIAARLKCIELFQPFGNFFSFALVSKYHLCRFLKIQFFQ